MHDGNGDGLKMGICFVGMGTVAARRYVTPGANVRPFAPACSRCQPTRECAELPSVRMDELGAF